MTFPELVEKTGLDLAIKIYKEIAGPDFEDKMTFVEWQEVIKVIDSKMRPRPFREVRKYLQLRAKTYSEWLVVLEGSCYSDATELPQKTEVMDCLFATIKTIAECKNFYDACRSGYWKSRYILALVEKAIRLDPADFKDWIWIFSFIHTKGESRELCLRKIEEIACSFDDWLHVYQSWSRYPDDMRQRAFSKLVELAK